MQVVAYTAPSENSFSYENTGTYTSTAGGGKAVKSSNYVIFYANKTDLNGKKVEIDKPEVDTHVICNGKEVKAGKVYWYSGYYYFYLYTLDGQKDQAWLDTFSDSQNGETMWIEFL